jgi:hypothetical protein
VGSEGFGDLCVCVSPLPADVTLVILWSATSLSRLFKHVHPRMRQHRTHPQPQFAVAK